jgi:hypothetical protein
VGRPWIDPLSGREHRAPEPFEQPLILALPLNLHRE